MGPSWWQILVVLVLVVLLFGRGKVSDLMGDVAKGIKSFKAGMADEEEVRPEPPEPQSSMRGRSRQQGRNLPPARKCRSIRSQLRD
jgi:sec-independent protein translocase protein TatA